jgi:hypothetical protein
MARTSNQVGAFWEKVGRESVEPRSEYCGMRKRMVWGCLVCGHEWKADPRDMLRATLSGCGKCAPTKRRKPNEVLLEYGEFLKLDISSAAHPGAIMLINKKKWEILVREGIGRVGVGVKGYPTAKLHGKKNFVHRMVMGFPETVDHINGIRWDNRLCNLREASHVQQQMNRGLRKTNTSGVIGVCWSKRKSKWMAELRVNRKRVHRSYHEKIEDAAAARAEAVREHCGEFAPVI